MAWSSDWWTNAWNGPVDPEQDELIKRLGDWLSVMLKAHHFYDDKSTAE